MTNIDIAITPLGIISRNAAPALVRRRHGSVMFRLSVCGGIVIVGADNFLMQALSLLYWSGQSSLCEEGPRVYCNAITTHVSGGGECLLPHPQPPLPPPPPPLMLLPMMLPSQSTARTWMHATHKRGEHVTWQTISSDFSNFIGVSDVAVSAGSRLPVGVRACLPVCLQTRKICKRPSAQACVQFCALS